MTNKIILFVSKGEHAASTRYRALSYFDLIRKSGWIPIHHTIRGTFSRVEFLRKASNADLIVILRKTFSTPYLILLGLFSKPLVFDFDDAIFVREDGSTQNRLMRRFARVVKRCNQVWAGNSYLGDAARQYNSFALEIPTSLDPAKYAVESDKPKDSVDLVWIGSSSTRKYLVQAIPILETLAIDFPSLRLKIVADFELATRNLCTAAIPWSEETEAKALRSAHIGIAPLPDNSRTRGKCGLKVLQYMAAGLPVVSSPTGVNKEIVEHGVTGFLAQSDGEWYAAIEKLINNDGLRQTMGENGQKRVMEHYSINTVYRHIEQQLKALFLRQTTDHLRG
jgi:glycosyltransferase involved in cell wall biosynthesis